MGPQSGSFAPDLAMANPKVVMVRKIRSILIYVELLLMVMLIVYFYVDGMAPYKDLPVKPLLPFAGVIFAVLLVGLIMAVTSISFHFAEILVTETGSQKFLLAQASMKGAVTTIVIAFVMAAILWGLPQWDYTQRVLDSDNIAQAPYGTLNYDWSPQDDLLIAELKAVHFSVTNNVDVHAAIYHKSDVEENKTIPIPDTDSDQFAGGGNGVQTYDIADKGTIAFFNQPENFGEYTVVVKNTADASKSGQVHFLVKRQIRQSLLDMMIIMCVLFGVVNIAWAVLCQWVKSKYRAESIYR